MLTYDAFVDTERKIRATLDLISAASVDEASWTDVSNGLLDLTGAVTNSLWVGDPTKGQIEILKTSFDASVEGLYNRYYHSLDEWSLRFVRRNIHGTALLGAEVLDERELERSEIYADFYRKIGIFHLAAATIKLGGTAGVVAVGLHRPRNSANFQIEDKLALAAVLPQLRRTLRVRHELLTATGVAQAAMSGLDMMDTPALAVDGSGKILHANVGATSWLTIGRGIVSRNGYCTTVNNKQAVAFSTSIQRVSLTGESDIISVATEQGDQPVNILATKPSEGNHKGIVLLLLLNLQARYEGSKAHLLKKVFGLTSAEAEVAEAAAQGYSASHIATQRKTSEATVRTQLRVILEKTQMDSLKSLTIMVAKLPNSKPLI